MKRRLFVGLVAAGVAGAMTFAAEPDKKDVNTDATKTAPAGEKEVAVIKTTAGELVAEFWPDVAPKTVENFVKLAKQGFYDGTCFHRIIDGFMIQGGDPNTKAASKEADWGKGDPGYKIKAEFNERKHVRGVLSMARGSPPDSAGCQFFVMLGDAPHLDRQYTGFGKVIQGEEVLAKIAKTPVKPNPYDPRRERSWPLERVGVESIKIVPASSVK